MSGSKREGCARSGSRPAFLAPSVKVKQRLLQSADVSVQLVVFTF